MVQGFEWDLDKRVKLAAQNLRPDQLARGFEGTLLIDRIWDAAEQSAGATSLSEARAQTAAVFQEVLQLDPENSYITFMAYDQSDVPSGPAVFDHPEFKPTMRRALKRGMHDIDRVQFDFLPDPVVRAVNERGVPLNGGAIDITTVAIPWENSPFEVMGIAQPGALLPEGASEAQRRSYFLSRPQVALLYKLLAHYDSRSHEQSKIISLHERIHGLHARGKLLTAQRDSLLKDLDGRHARLPNDYPKRLEEEVVRTVGVITPDKEAPEGTYAPHGVGIPLSEYAAFVDILEGTLKEYRVVFEEKLREARKFEREAGNTADVWELGFAPALYMTQGSHTSNVLASASRRKALELFCDAAKLLPEYMRKLDLATLASVAPNGRFGNRDISRAIQAMDDCPDDLKRILNYFDDQVDQGITHADVTELDDVSDLGWYVIANGLEAVQWLAVRQHARRSASYGAETRNLIMKESARKLPQYDSGHYFLVCSEDRLNLRPNQSSINDDFIDRLLFFDRSKSFADYVRVLRQADVALRNT